MASPTYEKITTVTFVPTSTGVLAVERAPTIHEWSFDQSADADVAMAMIKKLEEEIARLRALRENRSSNGQPSNELTVKVTNTDIAAFTKMVKKETKKAHHKVKALEENKEKIDRAIRTRTDERVEQFGITVVEKPRKTSQHGLLANIEELSPIGKGIVAMFHFARNKGLHIAKPDAESLRASVIQLVFGDCTFLKGLIQDMETLMDELMGFFMRFKYLGALMKSPAAENAICGDLNLMADRAAQMSPIQQCMQMAQEEERHATAVLAQYVEVMMALHLPALNVPAVLKKMSPDAVRSQELMGKEEVMIGDKKVTLPKDMCLRAFVTYGRLVDSTSTSTPTHTGAWFPMWCGFVTNHFVTYPCGQSLQSQEEVNAQCIRIATAAKSVDEALRGKHGFENFATFLYQMTPAAEKNPQLTKAQMDLKLKKLMLPFKLGNCKMHACVAEGLLFLQGLQKWPVYTIKEAVAVLVRLQDEMRRLLENATPKDFSHLQNATLKVLGIKDKKVSFLPVELYPSKQSLEDAKKANNLVATGLNDIAVALRYSTGDILSRFLFVLRAANMVCVAYNNQHTSPLPVIMAGYAEDYNNAVKAEQINREGSAMQKILIGQVQENLRTIVRTFHDMMEDRNKVLGSTVAGFLRQRVFGVEELKDVAEQIDLSHKAFVESQLIQKAAIDKIAFLSKQTGLTTSLGAAPPQQGPSQQGPAAKKPKIAAEASSDNKTGVGPFSGLVATTDGTTVPPVESAPPAAKKPKVASQEERVPDDSNNDQPCL